VIAWQVARHKVGIAGRVVDAETAKPIAGVDVTITAMPAAFKKTVEIAAIQYGKRWPTIVDRPDQTRTREDGLFYFMDLPNGKYTLSASLPGSGKRYSSTQETATVARDAKGNVVIKDAKGDIVKTVKVVLRPTAVKGKVTGSGHKNGVVLAEVRVRGSGERAFSDAQGQYVLAGIEPGKRTILVFSHGYRPDSKIVALDAPGATVIHDFSLTRETG
jgi:hypothetical protein